MREFAGASWHYPGGVFALTQEEIEGGITPIGHYVRGAGRYPYDAEDDESAGGLPAEPGAGAGPNDGDGDAEDGDPEAYPEAAE